MIHYMCSKREIIYIDARRTNKFLCVYRHEIPQSRYGLGYIGQTLFPSMSLSY